MINPDKRLYNHLKNDSKRSRKKPNTSTNTSKPFKESLPSQIQSNALDGTDLYIIDDESPIHSEIEIKAKNCQALTSVTFHSKISHIVFPHSATNNIPLLKSIFHLIKFYTPTIKLLPIMEKNIKYGAAILLCFPWPGEIILQEVFVVSQFWVQECYLRGYRLPESNYISTIFCSLFPRTLHKAMEEHSLQFSLLPPQGNFSPTPSTKYLKLDKSDQFLKTKCQNKENFSLNQDIPNLVESKTNNNYEEMKPKFNSDCQFQSFTTHSISSSDIDHSQSSSITNDLNSLSSFDHSISTNNFDPLFDNQSETLQSLNFDTSYPDSKLSVPSKIYYSENSHNPSCECIYSKTHKNSTINNLIPSTPSSCSLQNDQIISFLDLERNRPESEIEIPKVGDWVETKSAHEDSQIFKAKVISIWRDKNTWMFRLKSPDIGSTYIEPLKNVRLDTIWNTTLILDLARGRKSRRSSNSTIGEHFSNTTKGFNNVDLIPSDSCKVKSKEITAKHTLGLNLSPPINTEEIPLKEELPKDNSHTCKTYLKYHLNSPLSSDSFFDKDSTDSQFLKSEISKEPNEKRESTNGLKISADQQACNQLVINKLNDYEYSEFLQSISHQLELNNVLKFWTPTTEIIESECNIPSRANFNSLLKNGNIQILSLLETLKKENNEELQKILEYANSDYPSPFSLENHKYFTNLDIKDVHNHKSESLHQQLINPNIEPNLSFISQDSSKKKSLLLPKETTNFQDQSKKKNAIPTRRRDTSLKTSQGSHKINKNPTLHPSISTSPIAISTKKKKETAYSPIE